MAVNVFKCLLKITLLLFTVAAFGIVEMYIYHGILVIKILNEKDYSKISFAVGPLHISTLLSFLHRNSCCFSKLEACRPSSTVGNTLTLDKYFISSYSKNPNYTFSFSKVVPVAATENEP